MNTPVGVSIWFGNAAPHSTTLDILFRQTRLDARVVGGREVRVPCHDHAKLRRALLDLRAFKDETTGLRGDVIIEAFERLVRKLSE